MKNALIVKAIIIISICMLLVIPSFSEAITPLELNRIEKLKVDVRGMFKKGEYKQAIPLLETILSINPDDKAASRYYRFAKQKVVEHYCMQADESYLKADYQGAIDLWEKILEMQPDDIRAEKMIEFTKNFVRENVLASMYESAEEHLRESRYEEAVNELEKILIIKPDEKQAHDFLILAKQAMVNKKISEYFSKAEELVEEEKYEEAIKVWEKILEIDETQESASRLIAETRKLKFKTMYEKAKQLYEEGNFAASIKIYNKLSVENPTDTDMKSMVIRLNEVVNIVQKVEGEGEFRGLLRKALSNHIAIDGNVKAGIVASWLALQRNPESKLALAVKEFLEITYPAEVLSLEPPIEDMDLVDQYLFAALNHIYEGRYDLAILESSIIAELQPNNILALKRLGSAYYAIGNVEKSKDTWERALKLAPDDKELKKFLKSVR
jgi:tetratricopeptide (TPR) repeat protein